jgi:NAD(P)-dependent dehydrogenase (short-subunit alcohol dehydrogenase family)
MDFRPSPTGRCRPAGRLSRMCELARRPALVTEALSGLGPVITRCPRRAGVRFLLTGRDKSRLRAPAGQLGELGDALVLPAHLARHGEAERLAAAGGEVEILIASAGLPSNGRLVDFEIEPMDRALEVNFARRHRADPAATGRHAGAPRRPHRADGVDGRPGPGTRIVVVHRHQVRHPGLRLRAAELRGKGVGVSVVSPTFVSGAGL